MRGVTGMTGRDTGMTGRDTGMTGRNTGMTGRDTGAMGRAGRVALVAALSAALVGGCGIPDDTGVLPRGVGASSGTPAGEDSFQPLPQRDDTTAPEAFVKNYLQAAAGSLDDADARVASFLSPGAAATFDPQKEIRVVRMIEDPLVNPGSPDVQLRVQQIGVLRENGVLVPSDSSADKTTYTIAVQTVSGLSGLFVTKTPSVMLLSAEALAAYYNRRTIYFWNRDYTSLVPDIRYMPVTVTREQEPTEILDWLTSGPSPLLDGTVASLPDGTKRIGNVPAVKDAKLEINLTGQALSLDDMQPALDDKEALDRLRRQLMWSLRPNLTPGVGLELKIDFQVHGVYSDTDYLASNPAYRLATVPERFVVYDGRIHRLKVPSNASGSVPVVTNAVNRNVRAAALSSSGTVAYAALVAAERGGDVLRFGRVRAGEQPKFYTAALPAPVGYPSWATTPTSGEAGSAAGVIAAGGRLYGFAADAPDVRAVDWQGGPSGITAAAVAPDAHRLAVIAGGRLYIAALSVTGSGIQISTPQRIRTVLRDLTAVDWNSEGVVVVAGVSYDPARTGRVAIGEVSIDGAEQTDRLADLGTARVTHLSAYPANPVTAGGATPVAYEAGGQAYDVSAGPVLITAADLVAPVPGARAGTRPLAPFFME